MEQSIVVVGLCADRIEGSSVEVAELLNELIAEVGALLVLLGIVKVDLRLISTLDVSYHPHKLLTWTNTPRYDQISGICSSSVSFAAFPATA